MNPKLIDTVRPGDRVTIITPHGQRRTGKAVMPCSAGGWVLNGGGAHGTPLIAQDDNTIAVKPTKRAPEAPLSVVERARL